MRSTKKSRERICVYGGMGSGKTEILLQVARMCVQSGHTPYILDTDNAVSFFLDTSYSDIADGVVLYDCYDWESFEKAADDTIELVESPDDWILVDSSTVPWDYVQSYYVKVAYGATRGEWLLSMRNQAARDKGKEKVSIAELELMNWNFVNPLYDNVAKKLYLRPPCHLLFTAEAAPINEQYDSGETLATFKPFGAKPKGQKRLGFMAHTVLCTQQTGTGNKKEWLISTVKTRGDEDQLYREPWGDFPQDYLIDVAGWVDEPAPAPKRKKVRRG